MPGFTPGCGFSNIIIATILTSALSFPLTRMLGHKPGGELRWVVQSAAETALSCFEIPETLTYRSGRRQGVRAMRP